MKKILIILTIHLFIGTANAALISNLSTGTNNTVIDNSTGLSWLQLNQTVNGSVQSLIDTPLAGFNVANNSQVNNLFSGLLNTDLLVFQTLFGATGNSTDTFGLYISDDLLSAGAAGGSLNPSNLFFNILSPTVIASTPLISAFQNTGVFLVSNSTTTVPEPPVIWLFGSALIGLVGIRKKSRMYA